MSLFCAARRTFVRELRLMPRAMLRSQRKGWKVAADMSMETRATWELSMAWRAMPESLQSKLQSWTSSRMASTTWRGGERRVSGGVGEGCERGVVYLLQDVCLFETCFQHCEET